MRSDEFWKFYLLLRTQDDLKSGFRHRVDLAAAERKYRICCGADTCSRSVEMSRTYHGVSVTLEIMIDAGWRVDAQDEERALCPDHSVVEPA